MHELLLSLKFAWKSLSTNVGRTLLTISGVIIGTVAILVVSSAGDAVEAFVLGQIESYGGNTIQIEVKVPSAEHVSSENAGGIAQGIQVTTLTVDDAEAIKKLSGVSGYYAGIIGQALANYRETNKQVFLLGATSGAPSIDRGIAIAEGSFYTEAEDRGAAQVVVLGSGVKDAFFGESEAVGKSITIKGQSYRVSGVIEERGSTGFVSFDDFAYIPLRTLQTKILGVDSVSFITVSARDENQVESTMLEIDRVLRDRHDIRKKGEEDYSIMSIQEAQELVSSVFGAVRILLIALASISLVVGGVGIMNVLFVSVAERTSEIGLRKAVGARPKDILRQFLIEATLVALSGGLIGILLSFGILFLAFSTIASLGYPLSFVFSIGNLLLAIGFSFLSGIVFGTYPAWKASRIDPIQAIREG
jgi:putative ABC transport system permease protein